ncbi:MAG: DNA polymerase IV [bacterium]|nr:DNA polymerase IV [bacterium]
MDSERGSPRRGKEAAPRRTIVHVDMDAFFVAVERMNNPSLRGRPVIVGGSTGSRGVVSAASYEARSSGVHSAMPMTTARRLCPDAVYLPARHHRYTEVSGQVMEILRGFSPVLQAVSVDEAYLDLTGTERLFGPPLAAAQQMRDALMGEVGCSASIGIASNRMMSKIASELAKPAGIFQVIPGMESALLAPLSVEKIPGVGKVTAGRLRTLGVGKVRDLARFPLAMLEAHFKSAGPDLYRKARGEDAAELIMESAPKSLGKEPTFPADQSDPVFLEGIISRLADQATSRLRKRKMESRGVTLKIRYADFSTFTRAAPLDPPTDLARPVTETALRLLRRELGPKHRPAVRLLGVYLTGLSEKNLQPLLIEEKDRAREERLTAGLDAVRDRFGESALIAGRAIENLQVQMRKKE